MTQNSLLELGKHFSRLTFLYAHCRWFENIKISFTHSDSVSEISDII